MADANEEIELLLAQIKQIDEQLEIPNLMGSAKGLSRHELASWMLRAQTARDKRIERLVSLRHQLHQQQRAEVSELRRAKMRIGQLEAQLAQVAEPTFKQKLAAKDLEIQSLRQLLNYQATIPSDAPLPKEWATNSPTGEKAADTVLWFFLAVKQLEAQMLRSGKRISDGERKKVLSRLHKAYSDAAEEWRKILDEISERKEEP